MSENDQAGHDLPSELKAFEASLASLAPQTDGLDHDLIMFRAGQRSAMRKNGRPARARRVVMPIALVAMTSAAAALFVMLLTRPVVERVEIVHAPVVEQEREVEIEVESQPVDDIQSVTPPDDGSLAYFPTRPVGAGVLTAERIDEILQGHSTRVPSHDSPSTPMEVKAPVPYYRQLQELLAEQAS